jgi:two-component system sensor histidine kinase QseC
MSSKNPADSLPAGTTTLRRRLLRFVLVPLLASLVIAGTVSWFSARQETAEIYDQQLVLLARVLHGLAAQAEEDDDDDHKISRYDSILDDSGKNAFAYRIWLDDDLALTSPGAPAFNSTSLRTGFSDRRAGDAAWRVYTLIDARNEIAIEVAGGESLRTGIITEILAAMFIPLLLAVPLIAALVWYGIVRGLRPILKLSELIGSRSPENLAPLTPQELPQGETPGEIMPLIDALNTLMARTARVLAAEKTFTDHAAHELRTPLATMKVQAQVARRTQDPAQKQEMLDDLVQGVDRASHLVAQLLALARASAREQTLAPVDLSRTVLDAAGEFDQPARERGQTIKTRITPGITIAGNAELLATLARNLIDNAVKYAPASSTIRITLARNGNRVFLTVQNPGPPVPPAEQERMFEQFYRIPGSPGAGCGLGLALARRICEIHNATITLTSPDPDGQTSLTISFPALPAQ